MTKENIRFEFQDAVANQADELDFFIELLQDGITLEDIKTYANEYYDYSERFMAEHGLI